MTDHEPKSGSRLLIDPATSLSEEARLWRGVLGQAVRDVYSGDHNARRDVILWIKSKDFDTCCDLGCVPPEDLKEQMLNLLALPNALARKYGRILRHLLTSDIYD